MCAVPSTILADPCDQERDAGVGSKDALRWYFNKHEKLCEKFTYRGEGGNFNNFRSLGDCQKECRGNDGYLCLLTHVISWLCVSLTCITLAT